MKRILVAGLVSAGILSGLTAVAPAASAGAPPEWTPTVVVQTRDAAGYGDRYLAGTTVLAVDPVSGAELIPGGRMSLHNAAIAGNTLLMRFGEINWQGAAPAMAMIRWFRCSAPNVSVTSAQCSLIRENRQVPRPPRQGINEPMRYDYSIYRTSAADAGSWIFGHTYLTNGDNVSSVRSRRTYIAPDAAVTGAPGVVGAVRAGSPVTVDFRAWELARGTQALQREVKAWACVPSVITQGQRIDGNPLCQQLLSSVVRGTAASQQRVVIPAGASGAQLVLADRLLVSVPQLANALAPTGYAFQRRESTPILIP